MINNRDKAYLEAFGKHLQELRQAKGLSQQQLAFEAGLNKNQVGNIERGEVNTTISTILSLSKALDVDCKALFDFQYEEPQ
ncbi:MAG: helix-turn-helix domain-containing protein [Flavobacteriales bacterium]|nr:helix-turn-helix domain-containing protein [Flavobacteriales bacterium]